MAATALSLLLGAPGAWAQGVIIVPQPVAVAVPYSQAPYNNPYVYNNVGFGFGYRAPTGPVAGGGSASAPAMPAPMAGTIGSAQWTGIGGNGYTFTSGVQNPGGQAFTLGGASQSQLGNTQAFQTGVSNPGGAAQVGGANYQNATGQGYTTGAAFVNASGGGSVTAAGSQNAQGQAYTATGGFANPWGVGSTAGSASQTAAGSAWLANAGYSGVAGTGAATGRGSLSPTTGSDWGGTANIANPGSSAYATGVGTQNGASTGASGTSGSSGPGFGFNGSGANTGPFGTTMGGVSGVSSNGTAYTAGAGGAAAADNGFLLAAGPALPSGWYSAGSQLTQGGYFYGGPVTAMPRPVQQAPAQQPSGNFLVGYVPHGLGVFAPQSGHYSPIMYYAPTFYAPAFAPTGPSVFYQPNYGTDAGSSSGGGGIGGGY